MSFHAHLQLLSNLSRLIIMARDRSSLHRAAVAAGLRDSAAHSTRNLPPASDVHGQGRIPRLTHLNSPATCAETAAEKLICLCCPL